ncbi:putative uncharacterized protein DDB_G0289963 [Phymastichus coffea]|uniref:putative uncharacterized protein DDB_G0289963 n=1 Tax=Phymastichus coffea TaxID=108790 RepID=UPI00273B6570|nr:putative uncharacterized protein DDB_G0289963 [Phymastichus coffea]
MDSLMNDASLTKAEQEEEEMRHELKEVGLYYENMDVEEMRQLIDVLNESKNDVRKHNEDTIDSILFSETGSNQDITKIKENSTRSLPSFSYRQDAVSSTLTTQNSDQEESKNSNNKNLQTPSSNSFEKTYGDNSHINESIYNKNSNFKKDEDYPPLTSRYNTRSTTSDGPRTRSQESKKSSVPPVKKASLERWLLNPLEFIQENNIAPLCQPQHSESNFEESLSFISEIVDSESEEFDKLCQQMIEKLGTYNNQCMMELEAKDKKSAPIKINLEEASKSKVPAKENSINNQGTSTSASPSARNTYERATKRKALSTIAATTTNENVENSNDEYSNTKKKKCQEAKKEEEVVKKSQEKQKNKNKSKSTEVISIDDTKDSLDIEFDNSNLPSIRKNSKAKVSIDNKSNEQNTEYSRRIESPNAAKKNFKGPRAKKKNSNLTQSHPEHEKEQTFVSDEDIIKTLQEINDQIDDNDCVEITKEIKPPSMPKRVTKKLQLATNHLENVRESEEQKLKAEKREERLKINELRLQEQENEEDYRLKNQQKFDKQCSFYNNLLSNKSKVKRSSIQAVKTPEEIAEDLLLDGDDDEPTITKVIEKPLCPICQKSFPVDQIETHASECDAYAIDLNDAYNKPSTSHFVEIFKCLFCEKYETVDGNLYEDHVTSCSKRPERIANGGWISK